MFDLDQKCDQEKEYPGQKRPQHILQQKKNRTVVIPVRLACYAPEALRPEEKAQAGNTGFTIDNFVGMKIKLLVKPDAHGQYQDADHNDANKVLPFKKGTEIPLQKKM
jgi:hypothetical protein